MIYEQWAIFNSTVQKLIQILYKVQPDIIIQILFMQFFIT